MYWLFGYIVSRVRVRQLKIWCILLYCDALMVGLETFCCVFVVDVTKETAAW